MGGEGGALIGNPRAEQRQTCIQTLSETRTKPFQYNKGGPLSTREEGPHYSRSNTRKDTLSSDEGPPRCEAPKRGKRNNLGPLGSPPTLNNGRIRVLPSVPWVPSFSLQWNAGPSHL